MSDRSVLRRPFLVGFAAVSVSCAGVQVGDGGPLRVELPGESPPAAAEEGAGTAPTSSAAPASAPSVVSVTDPVVTTDAPDPPAKSAREQLELFLVFDRGTLRLEGSERVELKTAEPTVRRLGRFSIELFDDRELVERVRFDFPLLADKADGAVEKGLRSEARVRVPVLPEVRRIHVLDRKTRKTLELDWDEVEKGVRAKVSNTEASVQATSLP